MASAGLVNACSSSSTERSGARVVHYRRGVENRDEIAGRIVDETGATFIHPYNDPGVIAGQGTAGVEIAEQAKALGLAPEAMLTCAGGGGLTAGIALALEHLVPDCAVYPVEPEGFDDYARSLQAGHCVANEAADGSVCDAILTETPGDIGFAITSRRAKRGLVVSDEEALKAVAFAFRELKLVVEPGGAVALAALLSGKLDIAGKCVAIILSGGNIEPAMMMRALATPESAARVKMSSTASSVKARQPAVPVVGPWITMSPPRLARPSSFARARSKALG